MKKMTNCKACGQAIAKSTKTCPHCGAKNKKPIFKKWWFWAIAALLIIVITVSGGNDDPASADDSVSASHAEAAQTNEATSAHESESSTDEHMVFELIAGEAGEYGEQFTLNKDTELEETYYIYRIPAGSYKVTNCGDTMDQFSIYGDTVYVTDAGWEELSDIVYIQTLDVGESDTFTIESNQIIEIHEPAKFSLESVDSPKDESEESSQTISEQAADDIPDMTLSQTNALRSAQSYLAFTAFSYEGLIDQLEYEQYSYEDAMFAVDNCGADWDEQALNSALSYLEFTAFSYSGLIDQLEYEKFTTEQATYAADNCGADWNEQAARAAQSYTEFTSFSKDGLIDQLEYEGFTYEQAVYGVEAIGY